MTYILPSTKAQADKLIRQWGQRAFVQHCRNLGISFEDTYIMVFGVPPRGKA